MEVFLPSNWPRPKGYANGVSVRGHMIFVAGMTGWDVQGVFRMDNLTGQVHQALQNIAEVLAVGDARPEYIVRMTWYATNRETYVTIYLEIDKAFHELISSFGIAVTAAEVGVLIEDRTGVEIEVTAVVPNQGDP